MGNICTNQFEHEEGTETVDSLKNAVVLQVALGGYCSIDLLLGHYKQHRSESLLAIAELKNLQHCDPLRDYASECDKTIDSINSQRKTLVRPPISKHCPYKKLLLCVLPQYRSEECSEFQLQFSNVVKEVLAETKDMTVEFINTIDGVHTLPNQLLLAILFRELLQVVIPFKVHLITTEKRMMNMYKYELMKTEACSIKNLNQ